MGTNEAKSGHPVFEKLITILQLVDIEPNPGVWKFQKCPALATSSKRMCTKSPKNVAHAEALYNDLELMEKWTEADEFFNLLREFLSASHCSWHGPKAIESLEASKETRTTVSTSSATQPTSTGDHDNSDTTSTSASAVATMQPMKPVLGEAEPLALLSETSHKAHVHVGTVTDGISTMAISATSETIVTNNHDSTKATKTEKIIGLGIASLERKGSLRDHSPVFLEIYRALTPRQTEYGVVYVLEHEFHDGLFKIGWSSVTAEERLRQPGNCYGKNVEIVHQTRDGPFFAASKAERLAQTVLRHHNLKVTECEQCHGGHREWFRATKEMVIETVEIMETFTRLPAYELKDGKWKLSDAAFSHIKAMCHFSTATLGSSMTPNEEMRERHPVEEAVGDIATPINPEAAPDAGGVPVAPISQDSHQDMDEKYPPISSEFIESGKSPKGKRGSIGTNFAKTTRRVMRQTGTIIDRVGEVWDRSRQNMSNFNGSDKTKNMGTENTSGSETGDVNDAVLGVLWSMFPEDIKTQKHDVNNKEVNRTVLWAHSVKHEFRAFVTDFMAEWKREDEENRHHLASKAK